MAATPFCFIDDAAVTALGTRVADASTDTGMNRGASNAPGIGISDDNPGLDESLPNWTLLDQFGNARNAQISQLIGGDGIVPRTGNVATTWDTTQALYSESGAASSGGTEGTLPDAVTRFCTNPDNVSGQPNNDAPIVMGNGCDLLVLATGWEDAL